jgi:hypothetical protein
LHTDFFDQKIYKINPETGAVELTINTPTSNPAGVAWDDPYAWYIDGEERMVYQIDVGYVTKNPTISISTDSSEYCLGDTMTITLDIANPIEENVTFNWYWGVPQYSIWVPIMSVPIPGGYDETFNRSIPTPCFGLKPPGNLFYVQLLNTSCEVLDADAACWVCTSSGEMMPLKEIVEEINKTIETLTSSG